MYLINVTENVPELLKGGDFRYIFRYKMYLKQMYLKKVSESVPGLLILRDGLTMITCR